MSPTAGRPTTYLDPDHPLQQAIAATFADLTGEPIAVTAVDGCGAPLLLGVAGRAGPGLPPARSRRGRVGRRARDAARIADAIRAHPAYVSGTTRDERALLTAIPGAIGKAGRRVLLRRGARRRPGVRAQGRRRRRPGASRADGGGAAALGVLDEPGVDADAVRRTGVVELLGGGRPVGEIRAMLLACVGQRACAS